MKPGIRKLINFLFIGVTIALVCILAFGNSDLENAWEALVAAGRGGVLVCLSVL